MAAYLKKTRLSRWTRLLPVLAAVVLLAAFGAPRAFAQAEATPVENIADECSFYASSYDGLFDWLTDGGCVDAFVVRGQGERSLRIDFNGKRAAGLYIKWGEYAPEWTMETTLADGSTLRTEQGRDGLIQEYVELPENAVKVAMITADGKANPLQIVELEVYPPGQLPESVHKWTPTPTTAEIMFIATHQDDEILYLGGSIPYYAGELDYDSVVIYTAYDNYLRLHEALEGLWLCGERQHPVFMHFPDAYSWNIEGAKEVWDEEAVVRAITEQITLRRPQVIVTQDEDGEYGHGQHILTVHCVKRALSLAEDEDYLAENLPGAQPWTVKKCYLHLYWANQISMPWDRMAMESAGGKSAYQVACDAYKCHESQQIFKEYSVSLVHYDCRSFGLYWTRVGTDVGRRDFLENIIPRYRHAQPPEDEVTDYMERLDAKGWLYRRTDGYTGIGQYLRYCEINGVADWYAADRTGCPLEPAVSVIIAKDDTISNIYGYTGLSLISEDPQIFAYSGGQEPVKVRYCAIGNGTVGFYVVDDNGQLALPLTRVDIPYDRTARPTAERISDLRATDVILIAGCVLVACTTIALGVSVLNLSSKRRMPAGRRRRRR